MSFFVYAIRSFSKNKIYIGQTADLQKRIEQHNDPDNHFSLHTKRNQGPWILIYSESYPTRSEAIKREKWLKSGSGRRFIKRITSGENRNSSLKN